tara:strand:+ start:262 stop:399 length:138 start_codon:yes stop_codon:yes gene_type:complete
MAFQLQDFFEPWLNSTPEHRQQFLHNPRQAIGKSWRSMELVFLRM